MPKHIFEKAGGNLGTPGSVRFQFEKKGFFAIEELKGELGEVVVCMQEAHVRFVKLPVAPLLVSEKGCS